MTKENSNKTEWDKVPEMSKQLLLTSNIHHLSSVEVLKSANLDWVKFGVSDGRNMSYARISSIILVNEMSNCMIILRNFRKKSSVTTSVNH